MANSKEAKKILAIVGPTGSGKTALGIQLAKQFDGIIISADSRQVYRGLDIGTNKEGTAGSWQGMPARYINEIAQLLVDLASPGECYNLYNWLTDARSVLDVIWQHDKLPIVVGGTGLYVTALCNGYQPAAQTAQVNELEQKSLTELQQMVGTGNLNASDFQNRRRLLTFLNRKTATTNQIVNFQSLILEMSLPRMQLYERSDQRYQQIFDRLVEEAKSLIAQGATGSWLEQLGLDYRFAYRYIAGELSKEEAIRQFNQASHAYIRRQQTWWRGHGPTHKISAPQDTFELVKSFLA